MGIALKKSCSLSMEEVKSFDLIPYPGRVIVKEAEVKSAGLIEIPKESQEIAANEGIVIAIGGGVEFCNIGDPIYYAKFSGFQIERNGQPYRIMNEEDILGLGFIKFSEDDKTWII